MLPPLVSQSVRVCDKLNENFQTIIFYYSDGTCYCFSTGISIQYMYMRITQSKECSLSVLYQYFSFVYQDSITAYVCIRKKGGIILMMHMEYDFPGN